MKSIKTKIKNDFWKINYIVPFTKRHRRFSKLKFLREVIHTYKTIWPVKGSEKSRTISGDIYVLLDSVKIEISKDKQFIYFIDREKTLAVIGNIISNFPLDYSKIVYCSFQSLVEQAIGEDEFGREVKRIAEAIENFRNRVYWAIVESEMTENIKERRKYDFQYLLKNPAVHFDEALQRILFFNQIMWQTRHRLNGLGHLDWMLGKLYGNDLQTGYLNRDDAAQMVKEFLLQLSRYADYKSDALEGDIGQIIVLGGLQREKKYLSNELTEIFLNAQAELKKPDPKVLLRVSKFMPTRLIEVAVKCLEKGTGSPIFSNDDIVVPALINSGILKEDAYSYCVSACWEPFIIGKSLDQNNIAVFDFFEAFDKLLNSKEGQRVQSFEDFIKEYNKKNSDSFHRLLDTLQEWKWAKDPLVSLFTSGCIEKRKDVSAGGAIYNNYGITTIGLPNTVDSLINLKDLVFDSKRYTIRELNKIRLENFKNNEELYYEIKGKKHFGHDNKDVEDIVNLIMDNVADVTAHYKNCLGGTAKFGLSSPDYIQGSKKKNADLSGRKKGDAYSTHISCTNASYTEIVNFASHIKYSKQKFNGNVIDFFISPGFLHSNMIKFVSFMKSAIQTGYFQMQMNVMDSMTLIDAKKYPEKYMGLIVRVWGFSAYFNDLPNEYQDLLIKRAMESEAYLR